MEWGILALIADNVKSLPIVGPKEKLGCCFENKDNTLLF